MRSGRAGVLSVFGDSNDHDIYNLECSKPKLLRIHRRVGCLGEKGTCVDGVPWNPQARQGDNRNRCNGLLCEFRAALRIRKYLAYKIHTLLRNHWTSEKYLVLIVLRQLPRPQRVPGGTSDLQMGARRSSHLIRNHSTSEKFLVLIVPTPQPSHPRGVRDLPRSFVANG